MSKDNLFEVIVVATMSAGKTTVINSLIGMELLHSANEATTATITRIHDKDNSPYFIGKAYSYQYSLLDEQYDIDAETLKQWNANKEVKLIDLVGDIQALHNDESELVLYDTPGPNNSQDDNHEKLTMEVIDDGNYGLILYILNATQLGVNDDRYLLEKIKESLAKDSHKEIIFLLNKADCLDPEKGETLSSIMNNANSYLTNLGFKNPAIIPVCAKNALAANKVLNNQPLTRSQRSDLKMALGSQTDEFIKHATISNQIKKHLYQENHIKPEKSYYEVNGSQIEKHNLINIINMSGMGIVSEILKEKMMKKIVIKMMIQTMKKVTKKTINTLTTVKEQNSEKSTKEVVILGAMSSGKSTLINAMLGCDLLPAANEATTATIAQITDNDNMPLGEFVGSRINKNDEVVENGQIVTLETLKEWNSKADTKLIKLEGNIIGIKEREHVRLVLTDTPGPYNTLNSEQIILNYIHNISKDRIILYILDLTQFGFDWRFLQEIAKLMQKEGEKFRDSFIFVVNKMDTFDPLCGENIEENLDRVRIYLQNNGIENPQIYPVSANLTRLLRKRENNPDSLTRKERGDLNAMEGLFNEEPSMDLMRYANINSQIFDIMKNKDLSKSLLKSGMPIIEAMIEYHFNN